MQGLIRPSVKLMNRLRYPQKMGLMAFVISLPVAVFLYLLISEINSGINFAEKERAGVAYESALATFLRDLQQHRGMANALLQGDTSFREKLTLKEAEMEEGVRAVDRIDQDLGKGLKTGQGWSTVKEKWSALRRSVMGMEPGESFDGHTALIAEILALMAHVADKSNLTLDPDIDTAYLIDTMVNKLPLTTEYAGQIRALGSGALVLGRLKPEEKARLTVLSGLFRSTLQGVDGNLSKAFDDNRRIEPKLQASLKEALSAGKAALVLLDREVIFAKGITIGPARYFDSFTGAIDASFVLHDGVTSSLGRLLRERIERLSMKRSYIGYGALITALLVVYLFIGNYLSVMNAFSSLVKASKRIGSGDLKVSVSLEAKDEMAVVAQSFNEMAQSLAVHENALRESEERYRIIAETASDAIFTIDEESRVLFANQAVQKIFGYTPGEVIGQSIVMLMPERLRQGHILSMKRYVETGQRRINWKATELNGLGKDGREIPLEISYGEFMKEGKRFFTGFVRDISERRQAEKEKEYKNMLERFNRELESLVAERTMGLLALRLSDRVRTPATVIGATGKKLLRREDIPEKGREGLGDIIEEAGRLEAGIEEFQSLLKTRQPVFRYEDINEIVREILYVIEREADEKRVELVVALSGEPLKINAQKDLLRMAVFTMLRNAVESTPENGRAAISTSRESTNVVITISDSGYGIPKESLSKIFDPSYSARVYRFGMGMPLIKQIVSDHFGDIEVESEAGKGTTFRVILPARWLERSENAGSGP